MRIPCIYGINDKKGWIIGFVAFASNGFSSNEREAVIESSTGDIIFVDYMLVRIVREEKE